MFAEYMRFYSQPPDAVLATYAVTFFALCSQMYRIIASESLRGIVVGSTSMSGDDKVIDELKKQEKGLHGIVKEVEIVKGMKQ